jgi:hypothetical protein
MGTATQICRFSKSGHLCILELSELSIHRQSEVLRVKGQSKNPGDDQFILIARSFGSPPRARLPSFRDHLGTVCLFFGCPS